MSFFRYGNCIGYVRNDDKYCGKCKLNISIATMKTDSNIKKGRRINQNMKSKIRRLKDKVM